VYTFPWDTLYILSLFLMNEHRQTDFENKFEESKFRLAKRGSNKVLKSSPHLMRSIVVLTHLTVQLKLSIHPMALQPKSGLGLLC
jgi:hypothetical protein